MINCSLKLSVKIQCQAFINYASETPDSMVNLSFETLKMLADLPNLRNGSINISEIDLFKLNKNLICDFSLVYICFMFSLFLKARVEYIFLINIYI